MPGFARSSTSDPHQPIYVERMHNMKLNRQALIAALDVKIQTNRDAVDKHRAEQDAENQRLTDAWNAKLPKIQEAARAFARKVNAKTFDGDVAQAERDALAAAGLPTSQWSSDNRFSRYAPPTLRDHARYDEELPALRLLLTNVTDDEVAVSTLERLGFKSREWGRMFRGMYAQQLQDAAKKVR